MGGAVIMTQEGKDKRQARLILKKEVVINNAVKGYALDISIGGMYIYSPIPQPQGAMIDLRFDFEDGGPQIVTKGRVQYVNQGVGIGIAFFNLSVDNAERLKKFIEKNLEDHPFGTEAAKTDKRKKILIVDDVPNVRMMFKNKLTFLGFTVREAGNGIEALQAIEKEKPDLILLDMMMSGMDGLKFLQVLRANDRMKDIRVVVVSGRLDPVTVEKASAYGVLDFLPKISTTPNKLGEAVKHVMDEDK